ncbi:MAG: hypothetical protein MR601_00360 [Erysipelotrichaceae bacterium]|nr:hypothetical protein [Erysipelotrichaceae bacterium]
MKYYNYNRNKNKYNEFQYSLDVIIKLLIFTMILAFVLQVLNIKLIGINKEFLILDYYILGDVFLSLFTIFICWGLPLFIGVISCNHFLYFSGLNEKIFNRIDRSKFIIGRALKSSLLGFFLTLIFYLFCFIFLVIIFKVSNPSMEISVTLKSYTNVLLPYYYFENPLLYLGTYILVISLFGSVFSTIGFYLSLLIKNKFFIYCLPFIIMMIYSILANFTPMHFGGLFDYTNIAMFSPIGFRYFSKDFQIICGLITPIILLILNYILIIIKSKREYTL